MKCSFNKADILNGINIVSKAVPVRTTMTILECILITASEEKICLTANDMELGIETEVNGFVEIPGCLAIEAKLFSEIIRKLPESLVSIESDENDHVTIRCEKSVFHISGKNGLEFPGLPDISKDQYVSMSQFTLKEIIRQTIFSIAQSDTNKMMNGECLEVMGDHIRLVALDGHRISLRVVALNQSYENEKVIIPGKTLSEVSKILTGDQDSDVTLYFTQNTVLFSFDQTIVVSRLVEGEYFRIDQMLTTDYETCIQISKKEMLECLERSLLLVRENDKKPLILDIRDDEVNLSMNSSIGTLQESIPIQKKGSDLMIGFNPRFMLDAFRVIDEETVTLYMINSKSPCFIRDENGSYVYLILPVNFITAR